MIPRRCMTVAEEYQLDCRSQMTLKGHGNEMIFLKLNQFLMCAWPTGYSSVIREMIPYCGDILLQLFKKTIEIA
jgi:hypothetical protein